MTTAHHPQADGSTERANRTIVQIFRQVVADDQKDWPKKWPFVEYAINAAVNSSTGISPFELSQGYMPRAMPDLVAEIPKAASIVAEEYAEKVLIRQLSAHDAIITSRISQATQANKKRRAAPAYKIGDEAWLATKNLKLAENRMRKLAPKYIGPMRITGVSEDGLTVGLALGPELEKRRVFPKFHVDLLKPYIKVEDDRWPNRTTDLPNSAFRLDVDSFLIDEVIDHRTKQKNNSQTRLQFLVTWASGEDDSWVEQTTIQDTQQVAKYLKEKKVSSIEDLMAIRGGKGARARRIPERRKANVGAITVDFNMDRESFDDTLATRRALESFGTVLTIARDAAGFDERRQQIVNRTLGGGFADSILRAQRHTKDQHEYEYYGRRPRSRSPEQRGRRDRSNSPERRFYSDRYRLEPGYRPRTPYAYDSRQHYDGPRNRTNTPRLPERNRYNYASYRDHRHQASSIRGRSASREYGRREHGRPSTYIPAWSPPAKIRFCRNCGDLNHFIRECRQRDNPKNKEESKKWEEECDRRQKKNWDKVKNEGVEPWTLDWSTPPLPNFTRRPPDGKAHDNLRDTVMRGSTPSPMSAGNRMTIVQPIPRSIPLEGGNILNQLDALTINAVANDNRQDQLRQEVTMIRLPNDISRLGNYVDEANEQTLPEELACEIKLKADVVNEEPTVLDAYMSRYTSIKDLLRTVTANSSDEREEEMRRGMSRIERWLVQVRDIVIMRSAMEDMDENLRQYDRMLLATIRFLHDFAEDGLQTNMEEVRNKFQQLEGLDQVQLPAIPTITTTMDGYASKQDPKEDAAFQGEWILRQCQHPRAQDIARILERPMKEMVEDARYQVHDIIKYVKINILGRLDLWYDRNDHQA